MMIPCYQTPKQASLHRSRLDTKMAPVDGDPPPPPLGTDAHAREGTVAWGLTEQWNELSHHGSRSGTQHSFGAAPSKQS